MAPLGHGGLTKPSPPAQAPIARPAPPSRSRPATPAATRKRKPRKERNTHVHLPVAVFSVSWAVCGVLRAERIASTAECVVGKGENFTVRLLPGSIGRWINPVLGRKGYGTVGRGGTRRYEGKAHTSGNEGNEKNKEPIEKEGGDIKSSQLVLLKSVAANAASNSGWCCCANVCRKDTTA